MKKLILVALVLYCLMGTVGVGAAWADITLAWDAPTENTDGTALNDESHFTMYRNGIVIKDGSGNAIQIPWTTLEFDVGAKHKDEFNITAWDINGNESGMSNTVIYFDTLGPKPPGRLRRFFMTISRWFQWGNLRIKKG